MKIKDTLEEKIIFLENYIEVRDNQDKFSNNGNDDGYSWHHCGMGMYYHGKLSALKEIKELIK